ncbi:S8 family serine peptidase [Kribbella sandramycini]|uniref:S8 family serine peptidase n=1 Tax=Kribbella sandramycini TaxID=60450 RepID=A0A7Y4L258_9ACTN|nr:S8 family serine peptidase [Kribbella sandramycini]MBB6565822.1 subtilisin family serine protease [Kribbella sandramycini]NOL42086.1 S8 family serine peptidase [Kribbella sandramycini]
MRKRRGLAALAVLAVGSTMFGGTATAGEARSSADVTASADVTLITGDRVTWRGDQPARIRPAKGREQVKFIQRKEVGGDITVLPLDAVQAVRSGELDARLFNITKLIEHGYDDRSRTDMPLIVSGPVALRSGADHARSLPSVGGTAIRVSKESPYWTGASAALRAKGKQWIRLDGPVRAFLDKSVPQIGAPEAWKSGLTGKGTQVAVLDSGIDTAHPDLDDAVVAAKDFTESESGTADKHGHGTHVASIVTGDNDQYRGVAPDAKLLNGKVLGDDGGGSDSGVIAGMEWAVQLGADVVNMSLGSSWPDDGSSPVSQAVNRLTEQSGVLFVVAAGNSGGAPGSPASADAALTVGAVDHSDELAEFSSRGPRWLNDAIKPDITAPGVDIVAAKAKDSELGSHYPNVGEHHLRLSGTSMAAPHTAGAAAILAQQHPEWQAGDLKSALMGTAKPNGKLTVFEEGAGRVDVAAVTQSVVRSAPASISNGIVQWPHHDDKPISRDVTYYNSGTTPLTLPLRVEVKGPDGKPAPAGMFTVAPASLTIPAGGQATAKVTTDTAVPGVDGIYSGVVLAGSQRTPIAVTREVESYEVKLNFIGFDGQPAPNYGFRIVGIEKPTVVFSGEDAGGTTTVRLTKGTHYFEGTIVGSEERATEVVEPAFKVDGPREVTFDARSGEQVGFKLDKSDAVSKLAVVGVARDTDWGGDEYTGFAMIGYDYEGILFAPSRTSTPPEAFRYFAFGAYAAPTESTYLYNLDRNELGKIPSGLMQRVRDKSLARVRSEHVGTKPGTYGNRDDAVLRKLPFTLDEYYTPGAEFYPSFAEADDPEDPWGFASQRVATPKVYQRGAVVKERWGRPVFGPSLPAYDDSAEQAGRSGDEMRFSLPLFTDHRGGLGYSRADGRTVLSKDGKQLAAEDYPGSLGAVVPAGRATYQLHAEATRDNPLSSRIVVDWTFTSDTTTAKTALPLLAVRYTPPAATAAKPTLVPITVDHNAGGKATLKTLAVSHDNGTTWKPAPFHTTAGKTQALLTHPATATTVSLQATATDAQGNKVTQTILNAFPLN